MSKTMMERVAEAARVLAENGPADEGRSFRGFRQHTEQLTDRLISAMFPPYAAASLSRESALLEAAELLMECLGRVLPAERDPKAVAETLFDALPEVQHQLQTDLTAASGSKRYSSAATPPFRTICRRQIGRAHV